MAIAGTAQFENSPRIRTSRSVLALVLREMVTTYGRSPGGYIWAVLEPVAAIALMAFAFSLAFRAPSLGHSFALFYATGYLPYMLFHDVSSKTATAIRFSRPLLNFGAVGWFDVVFARFLLNTLTHLVVGVLVVGVMLAIFETRANLDVIQIAAALALTCAFAFGVGLLNAYAFLAFPAWERIWVILTRPLFIISGVFFLFEDVPAEIAPYLWFNPLFHVIGAFRAGFYPTYHPAYLSWFFVFGTSVVLASVGLLLLRRNASDLIHK